MLNVYLKHLWNVFDYWIGIAHNKDEIEDLNKVGFDETSKKKHHDYVTTMVDLDTRRVLYATQGKGADKDRCRVK